MMWYYTALIAAVVVAVLDVKLVDGFGYDYTIVVPGGATECYYQPITNSGISVEFEYQVSELKTHYCY